MWHWSLMMVFLCEMKNNIKFTCLYVNYALHLQRDHNSYYVKLKICSYEKFIVSPQLPKSRLGCFCHWCSHRCLYPISSVRFELHAQQRGYYKHLRGCSACHLLARKSRGRNDTAIATEFTAYGAVYQLSGAYCMLVAYL